MPILTTEKALRSLRKTPLLLDVLISQLSQAEAVAATDGPDGWSVLYVVCHLADMEAIYYERARMLLESKNPAFPRIDHLAMVEDNHYAAQELHATFDRYLATRREFISFLEALDDAGWARQGMHPNTGETTMLHLAVNTALHDVNHLEQIVRALGSSRLVV